MKLLTRLLIRNSRLQAERNRLMSVFIQLYAKEQVLRKEVDELKRKDSLKEELHSALTVCYSSVMVCIGYSVNAWKKSDGTGMYLGFASVILLAFLISALYSVKNRR